MSKDIAELATAAQEQFFESLQGAEEAVLEGVKIWRGVVTSVVPADLVKSLPKTEWLPNPATAVTLGLDFTERLFAHQRHFAERILAETTWGAGKGEAASLLVTGPPTKAAAASK